MQGTTVNGYKFVSLIGRGGMAEVWKAENGLGVCFAIKVLNANLSQEPAIVERFKGEAKIMVALNHPNIRKVIDLVNLSDGRPCIIMEYLEGADLASRMKRGEKFTEAQLRKWWNQMVDVLNYTHSQGVIHRDIKPSNIFINESGDVKLLDFGIARTGDGLGTRTGSNMGTLMYMSPEQVTDVSRVSKMSDVYSLAVTFVHLASGKPPYDSALTEYTIMDSIVKTPLDTSALPEPWNRWLKQYLIKEPASRAQLMRMTEGAPQFEKTPIPSQPIKAQPTGGDDGKTRIEIDNSEHKDENFTRTREGKKSKKWILPLVIGILSVIGVLFYLFLLKPNEKETYNACKTIEDYRNFLSNYPDGIYKDSALMHIEKHIKDSIAIEDEKKREEEERKKMECFENTISEAKQLFEKEDFDAAKIVFAGAMNCPYYSESLVNEWMSKCDTAKLEKLVCGDHLLSLQWISWDYFGRVKIEKDSGGKYRCVGEQKSMVDSDYLKLDGYITIVNEKHLIFEGSIKSKISHLNNGKEYCRTGKFNFKATGSRKYWREQSMIGPDGCTDYVDIYFEKW